MKNTYKILILSLALMFSFFNLNAFSSTKINAAEEEVVEGKNLSDEQINLLTSELNKTAPWYSSAWKAEHLRKSEFVFSLEQGGAVHIDVKYNGSVYPLQNIKHSSLTKHAPGPVAGGTKKSHTQIASPTAGPQAQATVSPQAQATVSPKAKATVSPKAKATVSPKAKATVSPKVKTSIDSKVVSKKSVDTKPDSIAEDIDSANSLLAQ